MSDLLAGLGVVLLLFVALWFYRKSNMNGVFSLVGPNGKSQYYVIQDVLLATGQKQNILMKLSGDKLNTDENAILSGQANLGSPANIMKVAVKQSGTFWGATYTSIMLDPVGDVEIKLFSSDLELKPNLGKLGAALGVNMPPMTLVRVPDATVGLVRV